MARYELGAIYKIDDQNGEIYYLRLFDQRLLWCFCSIEGRIE